MIAALDLDGVLADVNAGVAQEIARLGGTPWASAAPESYDVVHWDLVPEVEAEVRRLMVEGIDMYREMAPIAGATDLLADFRARGVATAIITARPHNLKRVTLDWLLRHDIVPDELIFEWDKAKVLKGLGAASMVDDRPATLEELKALGIRLYRPAYPYNAGSPGRAYRTLPEYSKFEMRYW